MGDGNSEQKCASGPLTEYCLHPSEKISLLLQVLQTLNDAQYHDDGGVLKEKVGNKLSGLIDQI